MPQYNPTNTSKYNLPVRNMVRTGECNMCGACCADNPWPYTLARYNEPLQWWNDQFPHFRLLGIKIRRGGKLEMVKLEGEANIVGRLFPYVWTERGVQKSLDDPACPFLNDENEDGERTCGLVGTKHEWMFKQVCKNGFANNGIPPKKSWKELVDKWHIDHPNCSFEYVEIAE